MAVVTAETGQNLTQPVGVREAAQVVHAHQVGARHVEAARLGAGGQKQPVVVDDGAVPEADGLGGAVYGDDGLAEVQLHVRLCVPGGFMDEDAVPLLLAQQIPLRQGRALVRVVALVTDEDHPAGEALGSECLGRLRARETSSDNDERLIRVDHLMPPQSLAVRGSVPHGA